MLATDHILEIRIWLLPKPTDERPHGLKYSLFFGRPGERIVGYDNELGKGDHRHHRTRQQPYAFSTIETLIADFEADVRKEIEKWLK
ncbi:DUF6516 family protein [Mesorhizobium sp. YM1C-6-2]|uniref:toxin-antitoxin system TumE family protein n=1 Tax=Mesorhizobium sp. YM1C-6-2 TaxID=1827501 RepID=UPI001FE19F60|nr:DUF6516 family protein [Mesorhizobium sp. YM1C-6-2]